LLISPFFLPAFQNGFHITPVAGVVLNSDAQGIFNPTGGVLAFGGSQGVGDQWGERADIFFV
jgi:hypothetical protein